MKKDHLKKNIISPNNPVILGKIRSPYGTIGWMKIFSFTEKKENIFTYEPWLIKRNNSWNLIKLETWKYHNKNIMIKIINIKNREEAKLLNNLYIIIDNSQLPILKKGEYYWKDLIGCNVITIYGHSLGEVINLIKTGSNDVLIVQNNLFKEKLIPFIENTIIKKVNIENKFIEVDWNII